MHGLVADYYNDNTIYDRRFGRCHMKSVAHNQRTVLVSLHDTAAIKQASCNIENKYAHMFITRVLMVLSDLSKPVSSCRLL